MRKIQMLVVAAIAAIALVGGWIASTTHAGVEIGSGTRIDPFVMMAHAQGLPTQHIVDFSSGVE